MKGRATAGLAALRGFNIRIYLAAQSLSLIGSFVQYFAQAWLVLTITHDRTSLPITVGLQTMPLLILGTWGGSVADRLDNRRLLLVTSTLNTACAGALGLLVVRGNVTVMAVYVFAVLSGVISAFERPALQAMLSELARPDEIASAVGLNAMVMPIARLVGPPVASVLIGTIGIAACFFVNAGSFVVFFGGLLLLRRREMLERRRSAGRKGLVREGLRYARHDPVVGPVLLSMFFVGLAGFNFTTVMPLMAKYTFHVGEGRLSVPLSVSAVGSLCAGMLIAGLKRPTMRMLGMAALLFGVVLVAYGGAPSYWLWVAVSFPAGIAASVYTTMVTSLLQQSSRPEMLGRVMALFSIAFMGTTPIGAAFVAWLSSAFTTRAPFIAGGIVVAATGAVTLLAARVASPRPSVAVVDVPS